MAKTLDKHLQRVMHRCMPKKRAHADSDREDFDTSAAGDGKTPRSKKGSPPDGSARNRRVASARSRNAIKYTDMVSGWR